MSDLVGNPEDRFSRVAAHFILVKCALSNGNLPMRDLPMNSVTRITD